MEKRVLKNGFTLIELLAVIILIGIIISIAVPAVAKYMKKGTSEYYKSIVDEVKQTGRDYLEDYRTLLPKQIGNVTIVELQELVNNNYIDEVKDENGNICEGRVTAKKTGKGTYEYYTCLKCANYKTDDEKCNFSENDNTGTDYKNYKVVLDKTVYQINQGDEFELPFAKVYYDDQLLLDNLLGTPRVIDTSKVGSTVVTYNYHGAQAMLTVTVVDKVKPTKPEVVLKLNNDKGSTYHGLWYSGNIYQKFKSNDYTSGGKQGSGIKEYQISTDQNTWASITGDNRITSSNGDQNYYVRSIDKSGNISEVANYNFKIDKETPSCTIGLTGTISSSGWYSTNVGISFGSIKDTVSGISYQILKPTSITSNTTGTTVTGVVTDKAGNTSFCTTVVKRDATTPATPTIKANDSKNSGVWHTADTTLTFSGSNSTSGTTYYYSTDNVNFTSGGSVKITTNTTGITYYAKACNNAGLCSGVSSYIVKLDKSTPSAPTMTANDNIGSGAWHTANFSITIAGSTSTSGITYTYGTSSTPTTVGSTISSISAETSSTTYYAKACNGANTCSSVSSYVVKIDKTRPTVSYSLTGDTYPTTKTVTITGGDTNYSHMNVEVYKDGALQHDKSVTGRKNKTFDVALDSSGTWKVYTKVLDLAGHKQSKSPENENGWYNQTYTITACSFNVGHTWDFTYKGTVEGFTVPCNGTYKFETWGAQGGNNSGTGGSGGYATGTKELTKNASIYITIGGIGSSSTATGSYDNFVGKAAPGGYNGGGTGIVTSHMDGWSYKWHTNQRGSGGGATHIATTNRGILSNYSSYQSEVLLVGGGGGGAEFNYEPDENDEDDKIYSMNGGAGGSNGGGNSFGIGANTGGGGWAGGSTSGNGKESKGGTNHIGGVTGGSMKNGEQTGNGFARITLNTIKN